MNGDVHDVGYVRTDKLNGATRCSSVAGRLRARRGDAGTGGAGVGKMKEKGA